MDVILSLEDALKIFKALYIASEVGSFTTIKHSDEMFDACGLMQGAIEHASRQEDAKNGS